MSPIAPETAVPELNLEANSFSTATGETPKNSAGQHPMFYEFKPEETVRAAHGPPYAAKPGRLKPPCGCYRGGPHRQSRHRATATVSARLLG